MSPPAWRHSNKLWPNYELSKDSLRIRGKVIAGVNAELIWREPVKDKTKDGKPESNHAVVVTGVDTARGLVHLNDSGSKKGRDEKVPIDIFISSWDSSGDQMTVTT